VSREKIVSARKKYSKEERTRLGDEEERVFNHE
jgi:hypothetical protein